MWDKRVHKVFNSKNKARTRMEKERTEPICSVLTEDSVFFFLFYSSSVYFFALMVARLYAEVFVPFPVHFLYLLALHASPMPKSNPLCLWKHKSIVCMVHEWEGREK